VPIASESWDDLLRPVGDTWTITVQVTDVDGARVDVAPVVTVTPPDGTPATPAVDGLGSGRYRASYPLAAAGRHTATVVAAGYGAALLAVDVVAATPAGQMPKPADVNRYLGEHSWTPEEVEDALAAEKDAQRNRCAIPAYYPNDLRNALLRRAQRNLAMRRLPLALPQGDVELGPTSVLPAYDPEVARLEKPHYRLLVG
jgi:hypothetical protein